jgi:hypothetical protein
MSSFTSNKRHGHARVTGTSLSRQQKSPAGRTNRVLAGHSKSSTSLPVWRRDTSFGETSTKKNRSGSGKPSGRSALGCVT